MTHTNLTVPQVVNGQFLDGCFVMTIYKQLLGKTVSLEDMAQADGAFYNSLKWMLENDITDVIDNVYTDDYEAFGVIETVELKPGGANIAVTEENKKEYVKLIVRHRLTRGIEEQVSVFNDL